MRVGVFFAAFVVPFAVAALPLLTLMVNPFQSSPDDGRLALTDVPISVPSAVTAENEPLAYGTSNSSSSLDCGDAPDVAIEG